MSRLLHRPYHRRHKRLIPRLISQKYSQIQLPLPTATHIAHHPQPTQHHHILHIIISINYYLYIYSRLSSCVCLCIVFCIICIAFLYILRCTGDSEKAVMLMKVKELQRTEGEKLKVFTRRKALFYCIIFAQNNIDHNSIMHLRGCIDIGCLPCHRVAVTFLHLHDLSTF